MGAGAFFAVLKYRAILGQTGIRTPTFRFTR